MYGVATISRLPKITGLCNILRNRPIILRSLVIVATPCQVVYAQDLVWMGIYTCLCTPICVTYEPTQVYTHVPLYVSHTNPHRYIHMSMYPSLCTPPRWPLCIYIHISVHPSKLAFVYTHILVYIPIQVGFCVSIDI